MFSLSSSNIKKLFLVFVFIGVVAFTQKDKFPPTSEILNPLLKDPIQKEVKDEPFLVNIKEESYQLHPVDTYELYGLIVSNHHSSSWMDISHEESRDYLNIVDLCVVYGENLSSGVYQRMTFQSGDWSCSAQTTRADYGKFKNHYLSNNHILSDNPTLIKRINSARKGDQIYIKGYLVNYRNQKWSPGFRSTSTTRDDYGCEIIYVTDFQILWKGNLFWRIVYEFSKWMTLVCVIVFFIVNRNEAGRLLEEKS